MTVYSQSSGTDRRLQALSAQESWRLLKEVDVGRVAFVCGGQLELVPVNFVLRGADVIVRTSVASQLAQVAVHSGSVVLEADRLEPALRVGWSVVLHGFATLASDDSAFGELPWPSHDGGWVLVVITPTLVTGRHIVPGPGGSDVLALDSRAPKSREAPR